MTTNSYTELREVKDIVSNLKELHGKTRFSDIIDDAGNQYVDIVMEGGGVLGIALVGYFYVLEEMGIRFLGIGGTSAGSITALLLASLGTPEEKKSGKIIEELDKMDMRSFVDGDKDVQDFIEAYLDGSGRFELLFKGVQTIDTLKNDFGLNPGDVFEDWLTSILKKNGVTTTKQLTKKMNTVPKGLRTRSGELYTKNISHLVLIAADITTGTLVRFPDMAKLYWEDPNQVNPARYVRASMSIPFFFYPFQTSPLDIKNPEERYKRWKKLASYEKEIPETCLLVDGGMMSNFPIAEFHDYEHIPTSPTFGVKLGSEKGEAQKTKDILAFGGQAFNAARYALDTEFINKHPDYKNLVEDINTSGHNWLNFSMDLPEKLALFTRGAEAAERFLLRFDWEKYKEIRKDMKEAHTKANALEKEKRPRRGR